MAGSRAEGNMKKNCCELNIFFRDFRLISLMIENKIIEMHPSLSGACCRIQKPFAVWSLRMKIHFAKLSSFNPPFDCLKKGRKVFSRSETSS